MPNPMRIVKLAQAAAHAVRLVRDPSRLDEVIDLADALARPEEVAKVVAEITRDPAARTAFRERHRVDVDLAALALLPAGTLGRAFADHMRANQLDPADLPKRPAHDDGEWLRAHLFETHDIWHVVTGFGTDVAGELGLQAFYFAQLPLRLAPMLLAGGMLNTLIYAFDDRHLRMDAIADGWRRGKSAKALFGVHWDELWTTPLAEVQARLAIFAN